MLVLALALAGCGDPCPESTSLEWAEASCDAQGWRLTAESLGPSSVAELRVVQSAMEPDPIWVEEHTLPRVATDDDTCADTLERRLPVVDSWEDQERDASTLFACTDQAWLTFELTLLDEAGEEVDCVVWGHYPNDIGDPSCRREDW